jgi:hypothetical protein
MTAAATTLKMTTPSAVDTEVMLHKKKRIIVNIISDNKSKRTKHTAEALEELVDNGNLGEGARYRYGVMNHIPLKFLSLSTYIPHQHHAYQSYPHERGKAGRGQRWCVQLPLRSGVESSRKSRQWEWRCRGMVGGVRIAQQLSGSPSGALYRIALFNSER